jgi:hypothetical protein
MLEVLLKILGVGEFYAGMDIGVCGTMGVAMFIRLGV